MNKEISQRTLARIQKVMKDNRSTHFQAQVSEGLFLNFIYCSSSSYIFGFRKNQSIRSEPIVTCEFKQNKIYNFWFYSQKSSWYVPISKKDAHVINNICYLINKLSK